MAKFIFKTNESSSTTYDGPSGTRYVIYGKKPFEVNLSQDIDFFKGNHRFEEFTIFTPKPDPKKDIDELLKEELDKLKITEKTKEKILKSYISKTDFKADLEENYQIDRTIPKKDMMLIRSHFLRPKKVKKKFDSIKTIKARIKKR